MKALLNAGFGGSFCDFVVFFGGTLAIIECGMVRTVKAGDEHLSETEIVRPGDAIVEAITQLLHVEVRTAAGDTEISEHPSQFDALVFGECAKTVIGITNG